MTNPYEDILSLPYPFPARRKRMALTERAAQFAPFAALSGFSDSITAAADKSLDQSDYRTSAYETLQTGKE